MDRKGARDSGGSEIGKEKRRDVRGLTPRRSRRSAYFGRNRARPTANARSLLPVGEDDRRRDREGIDRKTPAFQEIRPQREVRLQFSQISFAAAARSASALAFAFAAAASSADASALSLDARCISAAAAALSW